MDLKGTPTTRNLPLPGRGSALPNIVPRYRHPAAAVKARLPPHWPPVNFQNNGAFFHLRITTM